MADNPKTPAPPRRKSSARKTTRSTPPKPAKAEAAAEAPSATAKTGGRKAAQAKPSAPKPAKRNSPSSQPQSKTTRTRRPVEKSPPVKLVADTRDRLGDRNFLAAMLGGVAAIGATIAGIVFALRDGSKTTGGAHQADGTDSSESFNAGIADEGTIPE